MSLEEIYMKECPICLTYYTTSRKCGCFDYLSWYSKDKKEEISFQSFLEKSSAISEWQNIVFKNAGSHDNPARIIPPRLLSGRTSPEMVSNFMMTENLYANTSASISSNYFEKEKFIDIYTGIEDPFKVSNAESYSGYPDGSVSYSASLIDTSNCEEFYLKECQISFTYYTTSRKCNCFDDHAWYSNDKREEASYQNFVQLCSTISERQDGNFKNASSHYFPDSMISLGLISGRTSPEIVENFMMTENLNANTNKSISSTCFEKEKFIDLDKCIEDPFKVSNVVSYSKYFQESVSQSSKLIGTSNFSNRLQANPPGGNKILLKTPNKLSSKTYHEIVSHPSTSTNVSNSVPSSYTSSTDFEMQKFINLDTSIEDPFKVSNARFYGRYPIESATRSSLIHKSNIINSFEADNLGSKRISFEITNKETLKNYHHKIESHFSTSANVSNSVTRQSEIFSVGSKSGSFGCGIGGKINNERVYPVPHLGRIKSRIYDVSLNRKVTLTSQEKYNAKFRRSRIQVDKSFSFTLSDALFTDVMTKIDERGDKIPSDVSNVVFRRHLSKERECGPSTSANASDALVRSSIVTEENSEVENSKCKSGPSTAYASDAVVSSSVVSDESSELEKSKSKSGPSTENVSDAVVASSVFSRESTELENSKRKSSPSDSDAVVTSSVVSDENSGLKNSKCKRCGKVIGTEDALTHFLVCL